MKYPKISIVTPTFNRVEYLEECILSVISQGYPNLEYIICDGGSSNPELFKLLEKYSSNFHSWDSIPDNGHAEAIRRGFEKSSGEILGYLCSDDILLQNSLFKLAKIYNKYPNCDVFYGNTITLGNDGQVISTKKCFPFNKYALFTSLPWSQPSMFWTKNAYFRAGGDFGGTTWEYNIYEPNVDMVSRLQKAGCTFEHVPHFLSADRRHEQTVTFTQLKSVSQVSRSIIKRHHVFLGNTFFYPSFKFIMQIYAFFNYIKMAEFEYLKNKIMIKLKSVQRAIWLS